MDYRSLIGPLLCVSTVLGANSSQVIQVSEGNSLVAVSHQSDARYKLQDYLCVMDDGEETACGTVIFVNRRGALIQLRSARHAPEAGQPVDYARHSALPKEDEPCQFLSDAAMDDYVAFYRVLAANPHEGALSIEWQPERDRSTVDSVIYIGTNVQNPEIAAEFAIQKHTSISIGGSLASFSTQGFGIPKRIDATLFGVFIGSNYYSRALYDGFWLHIGMGYYNGDIAYRQYLETKALFSARILAGWRWLSQDYVWGFGVGAQYFLSDASAKIPEDIEFLMPSAQVHFGWTFN